MKHSLLQAVWYHIRRFMQVSVFLLHVGLLVPGLVFWIAFILLHGDMTAFALASDNLISRYLTASTAVQQNFQNLLCAMATVIYVIVAGFRWPSFWREIKSENKQQRKQRDA